MHTFLFALLPLSVLLISGCVGNDLKARRDYLLKGYNEVKAELNNVNKRIEISNTKNREYIEQCKYNTEYIAKIQEQNRNFWLKHAALLSRQDVNVDKDVFDKYAFLYSSGVHNHREGYDKDFKTMDGIEVMQYASLSYLNLSELKSDFCIIKDASLGAMPCNFKAKGFDVLLELEDGKLNVHTIGIVVLDQEDKIVKSAIFDLQKIVPNASGIQDKTNLDNFLTVYEISSIMENPEPDSFITKLEGNKYVFKLFFDEYIGNLAIEKGQHWGLLISSNAKIPCSYLGIDTFKESEENIGGVGIAAVKSEELGFRKPEAESIIQYYPGHYDEKNLPDEQEVEVERGRKSLKINKEYDKEKPLKTRIKENRESLNASIRFAVYGTIN